MHIKLQHIISVTFIYLLIMVPFSHAHDQQETFEVTYERYEAERKATIAENLVFTDVEAERFWPIYKAYQAETKYIINELIKLLQTLTEDMSNISNAKAENIVEHALDLETEHQQLHKDYILTLQRRSILSGTKLLRYYEIEIGLIAAFKNNLTRILPLVPSKKDDAK